ncbi:MAG: FAD-dependent thymidylate synthase [Candidatus Thermoplasmatota archaeon]|nr:FAD-dependent thymidylate synthase [Candidatus Thermoplasmatota archaeon]
MEVELIAYTPEPDRVCAAAARLTHSKLAGEKLVEQMSEEEISRLLRNVLKAGHTSVIEHASFTFSISGISRACSHQLVRHRIASYSQQSQRYVKPSETFVLPPRVEENGEAKRIFEEALQKCSETYQRLTDLGIPKEDARYIMPNATKTNIIVTINARSLINFLSLRLEKDAQWEIRELAKKMLEEAHKVAPAIFHDVYEKYSGVKQ